MPLSIVARGLELRSGRRFALAREIHSVGGMDIKRIFRASLLCLAVGVSTVLAQDEDDEPSYREALYYSEPNRDLRAPQAVRVGGVVFVSAVMGPGETFEQQLKTAYIRVQSALANYGMTMANVAQERLYLIDGDKYESASRLRVAYYREASAPAVSMVQVSGLPVEGSLVAVEVMAVANPEA